jgi:PAS domain S-box-containing protein
VVAPVLLCLGLYRRPWIRSWRRFLEAVALLASLAAVTVSVMNTTVGLLFLIIPFLGWAAWRFQLAGAAPAALFVAGAASWSAAHTMGPFSHGTLFERMLTLQAFNASVAFTSLFMAAVVTERARAREALERAAGQLEERVQQRTTELRNREQQLAAAQRLAHVGSWEWVIQDDQVFWSDEMYRIHGFRPQEFPVTFEKAIELVVPEDVDRIRTNVRAALGAKDNAEMRGNEYRIVRPDGTERVLLGRARVEVDPDGHPQRMVGTVQDITESKQAEREHRIAETLQRSLLPDRLPEIPGVLLAARYVPATADMEVGGDWYDVVPLPDGRVGLAIGDVAGHGLRAASIMGQLRMALRAYALEEEAPAEVARRAHQLLERIGLPDIATLVYLVFDPESGMMQYANAGHPPPLAMGAKGEMAFLVDGLAPPLGAVAHPDFTEGSARLAGGATLVLFTDGLVERRGDSLRDGLERLKQEVSAGPSDLEELCDHLVHTLVGTEVSDDIALLTLRPVSLAGHPLHLRAPADPNSLASLRQTLRRWFREIDAPEQDAYDVLVACGEACANAVQHAYGAGEGHVEVDVAAQDGDVEVVVRDSGRWRTASPSGGGRGLDLMRGLMDTVDVQTGADGTVVRMRRRVRTAADERSRTD